MAGISKKRIKTKTGEKVKYTITYYDVFGKQHTSGYYDTIKEAKKELWKYDDKQTNKTVTYGFIFRNFLNKVESKNAHNTYDNYKRYYEMYLKPYDSIEYDKVNSLHWQNVFDDIAKSNSSHVAGVTLKFCKAAVNHFIKHDILEKNVFNKIELIKPPKVEINHLTIDEIKYVLKICKKAYREYYPILYTFIGTGAREAEIFALEKTDFRPDENCIVISKQFNKGKLLQHPKTEHSNRKIYIFEDLKEVLIEHIKTLKPDSPLLFPNRAGNYINASNFRERFWKKLLELCNITKRVRLHDLRGSYIDMVLSSGLSVKFAQNQVGHSKSDTTLNVYAQNNSDMIQSATNHLNSIFEKRKQNKGKIISDPNKKIIPFRKKQSGTCF
jgi:integrase